MTIDEAKAVAGFADKKKQSGDFRNMREYLEFCIEWQRVTGNLLTTKERTAEAGLAKLADADSRERYFKEWTGKDKE